MGKTVVVGVRVPRELKEELERLGINYSKEIREFLFRLVRERRVEKLAEEMDDFAAKTGRVEGNLAAEFIREDRDTG